MIVANCESCPLTLALRWAGRALGLAGFAFVAWFLVAHLLAGEGPNPFRMSPRELALAVTFFTAVAGMVVGWRWETLGGVMIVDGMLLFLLLELAARGSLPGGWVLWTLPLPGVLYLAAAGLDAWHATGRKVLT
jgi:hypothetical protein